MGFAGSVIKWIIFNAVFIMIWVFGSYILSEFFSVSSNIISQTNTQLLQWQHWLIYIWNYSPIIIAVGSALWIIARSQENDVAMYYQ